MIGYVTLGTSDMKRARYFCTSSLAPLSASVRMKLRRVAAIGNAPMLLICPPRDGAPPSTVGKGAMVAILHGG